MRGPGEEPVECEVVTEIGNGERSGEECADMSPGCSECYGKRLRAVLKREPRSIATDHMTIPEMDFSCRA
jgi:hypothetical protein